MNTYAEAERSLWLRHLKFLMIECVSLWKEQYYSPHPLPKLQRIRMRVLSNYAKAIKYYLSKKKHNDALPSGASLTLVEQIHHNGMAYLPDVALSDVDFITIDPSTISSSVEHAVDRDKAERFAKQQGFHKIAADYFGEKECFFDLRSWRLNADAQIQTPMQTAKWHRDRDGEKVLKFFIYLSDVDNAGGEHEIALGSTAVWPLRFVPQVRFDDEEVKRFFRCEKIAGKAGTCFVEDTSILHKGNPPRTGSRDVVAITYYTGPIYWHANTKRITLTE